MALGAALAAAVSLTGCGTSNAVPSWFDDSPDAVAFLTQLGKAGVDVSNKDKDEPLVAGAFTFCKQVKSAGLSVSQVQAFENSGASPVDGVPVKVIIKAASAKGSMCPGVAGP